MKNIKNFKKFWSVYLLGAIISVLTFWFLHPMSAFNSSPTLAFLIIILLLLIAMSICVGVMISFIIIVMITQKSYDRKNEINKKRIINHLRMIERAIDNNNVQKAELLLDLYAKYKNHNPELLSYLDGVVKGKFYCSGKMNLEINEK